MNFDSHTSLCRSTPRRRWEENIRLYSKEMGINTGIWADSAEWRALVKEALNLQIP